VYAYAIIHYSMYFLINWVRLDLLPMKSFSKVDVRTVFGLHLVLYPTLVLPTKIWHSLCFSVGSGYNAR
jgi:hypothetical protein